MHNKISEVLSMKKLSSKKAAKSIQKSKTYIDRLRIENPLKLTENDVLRVQKIIDNNDDLHTFRKYLLGIELPEKQLPIVVMTNRNVINKKATHRRLIDNNIDISYTTLGRLLDKGYDSIPYEVLLPIFELYKRGEWK